MRLLQHQRQQDTIFKRHAIQQLAATAGDFISCHYIYINSEYYANYSYVFEDSSNEHNNSEQERPKGYGSQMISECPIYTFGHRSRRFWMGEVPLGRGC